MKKLFIQGIIFMIVLAGTVFAINVNSVSIGTMHPASTEHLTVNIENVFNQDAKNVVLTVDPMGLPFNIVGSSSFGVDEINENDDENFVFILRASPTAKPGEYQIPYTIEYDLGSQHSLRKSSIGVKVTSESLVDFSANAQNPVIGNKGKLDLTVVNNGLGNLRFVSVKISPKGFTLLSDSYVHIGDVASDDFEVASFDVLFTSTSAKVKGTVEYRDVENNILHKDLDIPLKVYTQEEALSAGIIQKNNSVWYISIAVGIIILWLTIRQIRKRRRLRMSRGV